MATVHVVRHLVLVEGRSQREVARELGISRNTVRRYLDDTVEAGVRVEEGRRPRPVRDQIEKEVLDLLSSSRTTTKQRLTAARVRELLAERGLEASRRTVSRVLGEWRRRRAETFVPLEYHPGDLAEVDFFEVVVEVDGVEQKAHMFVMRLMYSGRDFAWLYSWQDQAAFLDGHVRAFEHFGRVPRRILYDNLKAAVRKHLVGSRRLLTQRFLALAAHYGFDPRFARPRRGSDKGGVEARGKAIRWQHLTPVPQAEELEDISQKLLARLDRQMDRPRRRGDRTVAELWDEEAERMATLPCVPHDPGVLYETVVDRQSRVRVRNAWYSVWSRWQGLRVKARLYADRVVIVHGGEEVAHRRQPGNGKSIHYPHYLPELARKTQALEQVGDLLAVQLGEPFDRLWKVLVDRRGKLAAARGYRRVLQALLDREREVVARAVGQALDDDEPLLALRPTPTEAEVETTLPVALQGVQVEATALATYDELLGGAS